MEDTDNFDGNNNQEYLDDDDELKDVDDDESVAGDGVEAPGEKRLNMKDNPLDRRALQSLEKQLELEIPDSIYDIGVCDKIYGSMIRL